MLCRHCRKAVVCRPRGLCWTCFYKPGVRDLYPKRFAPPLIGDGHGSFPLPPWPTRARPGTPEKIEVFHQRALGRFQLFHPNDAHGDDELHG